MTQFPLVSEQLASNTHGLRATRRANSGMTGTGSPEAEARTAPTYGPTAWPFLLRNHNREPTSQITSAPR
jgi:hypothetical protein